MGNKLCVIIDDVNQERVFASSVIKPLKRDGFYVDVIHIETTSRDILDEDNNIDVTKLQEKLAHTFNGRAVDIVATDFDLSDEKINGVKVVELIRQIRPNVPVLIYSGKLESVIKHILGDYKQKSSRELIASLKKLIRYNIIDYVEREGYPSAIIKHIKSKEAQLLSILLNKIREYSHLEFKSCYPSFSGRTLANIADEIEAQTPQGRDFQEQLIEQTIAYMIKINNDD